MLSDADSEFEEHAFAPTPPAEEEDWDADLVSEDWSDAEEDLTPEHDNESSDETDNNASRIEKEKSDASENNAEKSEHVSGTWWMELILVVCVLGSFLLTVYDYHMACKARSHWEELALKHDDVPSVVAFWNSGHVQIKTLQDRIYGMQVQIRTLEAEKERLKDRVEQSIWKLDSVSRCITASANSLKGVEQPSWLERENEDLRAKVVQMARRYHDYEQTQKEKGVQMERRFHEYQQSQQEKVVQMERRLYEYQQSLQLEQSPRTIHQIRDGPVG